MLVRHLFTLLPLLALLPFQAEAQQRSSMSSTAVLRGAKKTAKRRMSEERLRDSAIKVQM